MVVVGYLTGWNSWSGWEAVICRVEIPYNILLPMVDVLLAKTKMFPLWIFISETPPEGKVKIRATCRHTIRKTTHFQQRLFYFKHFCMMRCPPSVGP